MQPGDPFRVLTIVLLIVGILRARRLLRFRPDLRSILISTVSWAVHVVAFYIAYILTSRWEPPFHILRQYWPAMLVFHAALVMVIVLSIIDDRARRKDGKT